MAQGVGDIFRWGRVRACGGLAAVLIGVAWFSVGPAGAAGVHPHLPGLSQSPFTSACGDAVDSDGNLYVADAQAATIFIYDPSGAAITSFNPSGAVCGIAVDSDGNVYASQFGGSAQKYISSTPGEVTGSTAYELDKSIGESAPGEEDGDGTFDSGSTKAVAVDPTTDDVYTSHPGLGEEQTVNFTGFSGEFTIGLPTPQCSAAETAPITYAESTAGRNAIRSEIWALCGGNVNSSVSGNPPSTTISFKGALAGYDFDLFTCNPQGGSTGSCIFEETTKGVPRYISQYETDGTLITDSIGSGLEGPSYSGLDVYGVNGRVFAFDGFGGQIAVFNPGAANPLTTFDGSTTPAESIGAGPLDSAGLAVDQATGHVFVFDATHGLVVDFKPNGEFVTQITESLVVPGFPPDVAVDNSGGENEGTIYAADGASVEAFGRMSYGDQMELNVFKEGSGEGTVAGGSAAEPDAIDCGTTCDASFDPGTEVMLTAGAETGSIFTGWTGCDSTEGAEGEICKVTMDKNKAVTATFVKRRLSVEKEGPGTATITSDPPGIDCGSTCEANFGNGDVVMLTASPAGGSKLKSWTGCDEVLGPEDEECEVTMNDNRSVTAFIAAEPAIDETSVSGVGSSFAKLEATLNPNGELTGWHFEYVDDAEFQANGFENAEKTPDSSAGAGSSAGPASRSIAGLTPGTTYHFRLVASNFASPVDGTGGPDAAFTTYLEPHTFPPCPNDALRTGPSARLPDCRAYEQASPADKNGIDVLGRPDAMAASDDGDAVLYYALNGQGEGGGPQTFPVSLARRGSDGWSASGVLPPVAYGNNATIVGWLPDLSTAFSGANDLFGSDRYFLARKSPDGSLGILSEDGSPSRIVGSDAGGSIVYFEGGATDPPLTSDAVPNRPNVYAWDRDSNALTLAGVLPDSACGAPPCIPSGGSTVQSRYAEPDHAVGEAGDAYFTDAGTGQLYLRQDPLGTFSTLHVSASQKTDGPGPGGVAGNSPQPARFQAATPDGSSVFFTSAEELTDDAYTGPEPVIPPQPPIAIGRSNPDGTGKEAEFIPTSADWVAVSPESASPRYVYWSKTDDGTISRAEIGGANPEPSFIEGLENPEAVAVDSAHIYWAEARDREEGNGTIARADLNGGNVEKDFITGAGDPHGVAVSPESASPRYVYWTNGTSTDIGRAEINGANVEPMFIQRIAFEHPWGIAVNATHLYWVEDGEGVSNLIIRTDLNGGSETFKQTLAESRGIAIDSTYVYWTRTNSDRISRRTLDLENQTSNLVTDIEGIFGLAVDAEHLYWSANPPEVPPPSSPGNDLYRYDVDSGTLTDLAPEESAPNGAEVRGFLGASEDGSYVYFVANADLDDGGPATAGNCSGSEFAIDADPDHFQGECSLYLAHDDERPIFVARLDIDEIGEKGDKSDAANWEAPTGKSGKAARVSADGKTLLFRSQRKLTTYDNQGMRCEGEGIGRCPELYRYRVGDGLSCVSCNPTGAAPTWPAQLSQILPGNGIPNIGSASQQRNLSAGGDRIFFESADKLVAADVNGDSGCPLVQLAAATVGKFPACLDVYMWEAEGTGSCESSAQNGGCLYLISSGAGAEPAFFLDASEDGEDAFFFTQEQLVPQDTDGLRDVYDARVEGGLASQHAAAAARCEGEACRSSVGPPPPGSSSPGSSSFSGPGNLSSAGSCAPAARRARRLSRRAGVLRRRARGAKSAGQARRMRRRARRYARRARGLSRTAKRCRRAERAANRNRRASR